jgi:hypothetical protein
MLAVVTPLTAEAVRVPPEMVPPEIVAVLMVPAPEIFPEASMTIDGVLRKLVKPVLEEMLMPLTVPLDPAARLRRLEVLPVLVAAFSVIDNPVAVFPAPAPELLVKEMFCKVPVVKEVSVKAIWLPVAVVDVTVRPVKVPTEVKEDVTTVAFNTVPVSVPAGAITALPEAAVIKPLPFTVKVGMLVEDPKDPTLELTVANVVAKDPAEVVMSPVRAGNLPAANVPVALVPERSTGWAVITWPEIVR